MSKNKAIKGVIGLIVGEKKRQESHNSNFFRGRHRVVMLTNKEVLLSFSASGNVAFTDKDVRLLSNGVTASSVSTNAIAVILQLVVQDTASAANSTYIQVRRNGSTDNPGHLFARGGHINSMAGYASGIVAIDSDFLIEYSNEASGANTLTGTVNLIGYIEQLS